MPSYPVVGEAAAAAVSQDTTEFKVLDRVAAITGEFKSNTVPILIQALTDLDLRAQGGRDLVSTRVPAQQRATPTITTRQSFVLMSYRSIKRRRKVNSVRPAQMARTFGATTTAIHVH